MPKQIPKNDFFKKNGLKRSEFREKLRKDSGKIPDTSTLYKKAERVALEKKFGHQKYGPRIGERDVRTMVKKLREEKRGKKWKEKREINHTIGYLKRLGNIK